jgi:hypothetical protein
MNAVAVKLREQLHYHQGDEPMMALLRCAAEEIERLDPEDSEITSPIDEEQTPGGDE